MENSSVASKPIHKRHAALERKNEEKENTEIDD